MLATGETVALVPARPAISGTPDWLGTTGKSQLAADIAESAWQAGRVDMLAWVNATTRASVLAGYARAAITVLGSDSGRSAESAAARFVNWLSETSHPWLVVLDNLRDPEDVRGLWPQGPAGTALITATDPRAVPQDQKVLLVPLGPFSGREAMAYLRARLAADPDQRAGMIDLVTELGGEPLALAQAGGMIATSRQSCREYLESFTGRRERADRTIGGPPPAVSVSWTLSAEHADALSDGSAWPVLALAALLDGRGFPAAILRTSAVRQYLAETTDGAGRDGTRPPGPGTARPGTTRPGTTAEPTDEALHALEQTGLLAMDLAASPATIWMNQLLQAAIRSSAPAPDLAKAALAAADGLLELWPATEATAWQADDLRACAASLHQAAGDLLWEGGCHPLLLRAGQSLAVSRMTGPACAYWNDLAVAADRMLGRDHPDTAMIASRLADAHLTAGNAAQAVPVFNWILAKLAGRLGEDHLIVLEVRLDVGRALTAASEFSDAVAVLDRTVGDYERLRGSEHLDTIRAREQLAAARHASGRPADAIAIYRRTLTERERIQGPRHADAMTTREKLADACLAEGLFKEAVNQSKRVLADRERVLGPGHLDTVAARGNLASAFHAAGKMASAVQCHEEACAGYERLLGVSHPETLARRANLARSYYAVGRLTDAASLLRDILGRCERVLPPGDPVTEAVRESLASFAG